MPPPVRGLGTLRDTIAPIKFAQVGDTDFDYDLKSAKKHLLKGGPNELAILLNLRVMLDAVEDRNPEPIKVVIAAFTESKQISALTRPPNLLETVSKRIG